jgi:hypothetical protein
VLNDIRTLFMKQDELRKQVWSLQSQLKKSLETSDVKRASLDSISTVFSRLVRETHAADSTLLAELQNRLSVIEHGTRGEGRSAAAAQATLPLVLAGCAVLVAAMALVVTLRRTRRVRISGSIAQLQQQPVASVPSIAPLANPISPVTRSPEVVRESLDEPEDKPLPRESTPDKPTTRGDQIPVTTLSKRSEIMKQLEKKPKPSKNVVRSTTVPRADRKRLLTDRASELILLTSRGQLTESERQEAEKEIAGILREMMELR